MFTPCTALRTNTLENIIDVVDHEILGQSNHRHMNAAQAESALTTLTVEMGVEVIKVLSLFSAMTRRGTHGILYRAASIVNGMNEVMSKKKGYAPINRRLVDGVKTLFQALQ